MATVSTVLRRDAINKNGEAPINFFVIKDRKLTKVSTGIMIDPKHWDEKKSRIKPSLKNSARLNSFLTNKFTELQDKVFEHETIAKSLTARQLKDKIYGRKPTDFFQFAEEVCQAYLTAGQVSTHVQRKGIIHKIKEFAGNGELMFQDITIPWLNKYEQFCRTKFENKTNTIHKDLKFVRLLFNKAYQQDFIDLSHNPFLKYKLKTEKTQRSFLTEEELTCIENFPATSGSRLELHRDMFVFAAYAGGLRVSDVLRLKWKNFDGVRVNITIKKTTEPLSVKLPNKSLEIIEKYKPKKPSPDSFIFPMLSDDLNMDDPKETYNAISTATAYINKNLKIVTNKCCVDKKISFHISRHTWATRALRKGISIDKVSKLMGHAAIKETQIYAKIVNEELEKAMDVFNE